MKKQDFWPKCPRGQGSIHKSKGKQEDSSKFAQEWAENIRQTALYLEKTAMIRARFAIK